MNCRICGSKVVSLRYKKSFFDIYRCEGCGVLFAGKLPNKKRLADIYTEGYYAAWNISQETEVMKRMTFSSYLSVLEDYVDLEKKSLLDIGCATGYLLCEAKKRGCDCYGVELNPYGFKEASKRFPGRIFGGKVEDAGYKDKYFDIVTMVDLIEHTTHPVLVLQEVRRVLKDNGCVLMITPNVGGGWARILGGNWTNFKEEHLYYFNSRSIKKLAQLAKMKVVFEKPVVKYLTLGYIYSQLMTYETPVLTQVARLFNRLPKAVKEISFPIMTGDFLVVMKKDLG